MRIVLIIIAFFLLWFGAGKTARYFYKDYAEARLTKQTNLLLKRIGEPDVAVKYDHLIAKAEGFVETDQGKSIAVDSIDTRVHGAYVYGDAIKVVPRTPCEVVATVDRGSGLITLTGLVPDEPLKEAVGAAAAETPGVQAVENQLEIGSRMLEPTWRETAPPYLTGFFSVDGAAKMSLLGEKLTLEGTVDTDEIKKGLTDPAGEVVVEVEDLIQVAPPMPATFLAQRSGDNIVVTGVLPNTTIRDALVSAVRTSNPGKNISDRTEIGSRLIDPWWPSPASQYIPRFFQGTIGDALVAYDANAVRIEGTVADDATSRAMIAGAGSGMPTTFALKPALKVLPPPPNALITGGFDAQGQLVVSGNVADAGTKNDVLNAVRAANLGTNVVDQLQIEPKTINPNWLANPAAFLSEYMNLTEAEAFELRPRSFLIRGNVKSDQIKMDLGQKAAAIIGSQGVLSNELVVMAPPPTEVLAVRFKETAVYFDTASSVVKAAEAPKVEEMANAIKEAGGDYVLTVGGYADQRGNADYNRRLSLDRANAVRDRLIGLGIPAERLTVEFFGEDVSEWNADDLWKARRVELSLKKTEE